MDSDLELATIRLSTVASSTLVGSQVGFFFFLNWLPSFFFFFWLGSNQKVVKLNSDPNCTVSMHWLSALIAKTKFFERNWVVLDICELEWGFMSRKMVANLEKWKKKNLIWLPWLHTCLATVTTYECQCYVANPRSQSKHLYPQ